MTRLGTAVVLSTAFLFFLSSDIAPARPAEQPDRARSITDRGIHWPSRDHVRRVLLLEDYNTRIVILGVSLLGGAAGLVGSFTLLRKRALMGDALSHATLPGIGLAFIIATTLGANGKSLPVLLLGATLSGLLGVATILLIRNLTRLKEDAALGIVLSVFFGVGISLFGVIQQMEAGHAAGLEAFIYGKAASLRASDAKLIGGAALFCVIACLLLFKELKLLCFDEAFAGSRGMPVVRLDMALMALVVVVSIVGLQAVGLILMIALLVIPAAAARFWSNNMSRMAFIASGLGVIGCLIGAAMSALFAKLPSGAMIVLVCTVFFLFSMFFGSARGIVIRSLRRLQLNRKVGRQHLLRAMYESLETTGVDRLDHAEISPPVTTQQLLTMRSWSPKRLRLEIRRAEREGLVQSLSNERVRLTREGYDQAAHLTRQHRLWELYLITYADIAPSHVDRDADAIEHVLEPRIIAQLEKLLDQRPAAGIPASPHELVESGLSTAYFTTEKR